MARQAADTIPISELPILLWNHMVDETEPWCTLMGELVAVGRDAVPQLCAELDRTSEDRMGLAGNSPSGVGFHTGVRFNVSSIIP